MYHTIILWATLYIQMTSSYDIFNYMRILQINAKIQLFS